MRRNEEETHESYGMMQFNRISGSIGPLYGTPIESNGAVRFTLTESSREFDSISGDHYRDGKIIAEGMMSAVQFAELITTMNHGCGVPVTLGHVRNPNGPGLIQCEKPPSQESEAKKIRESFEAQVAEKRAAMKAVKRHISKLLDESRIPKKRIKDIEHEIHQFFRLFDDTAPFMMGTFEESVSATVAQAKTEVGAYVSMIAERTGIAALKSGVEVPLLDDGEEKDGW